MKLIDASTPKYPNTFAMVDDEDFERLNQYRWRPVKGARTLYLARHLPGRGAPSILMHFDLVDAPDGMERDHKDRNGLNNQKNNLRICTRSQNACNRRKQTNGVTSKFIGVAFHARTGKYQANIQVNGKPKYLGLFKTQEEAATVRNKAAQDLHGEFVSLNRI
jgi:hypothetical protein